MSDSQQKPWSNNPNAPKIPHVLYFQEKANLAGILIASILYGITIVLFFQCIAALLNPAHRGGERIKWWLVSYTAVIFSSTTVLNAMQLNIQSICYIDNREFPGVEDVLPPGPLGYLSSIFSDALTTVPDFMFLFNGWLADGLMLYRCYIIYARNIWVIAFPCLMYLGYLAMGIMLETFQIMGPNSSIWSSFNFHFTLPNFSISIALNILLTLMIVIRLIIHSRNLHAAIGSPAGIGRLYNVVTMLVESCALSAVSSLLFIVSRGAGNHAADIFLPIFSQTQVISPLLIIKRVAEKSALTSDTVVSGTHISSFEARSRGELTVDSGTLPDPASSWRGTRL